MFTTRVLKSNPVPRRRQRTSPPPILHCFTLSVSLASSFLSWTRVFERWSPQSYVPTVQEMLHRILPTLFVTFLTVRYPRTWGLFLSFKRLIVTWIKALIDSLVFKASRDLEYTVCSLINRNATITSRLPARTAWLIAKRHKTSPIQVSLRKKNQTNL